MPAHRTVLATVAAVVAVLLLPLAASASTVTARVVSVERLSGASPFDGCGVPGVPTLSSEAEPHLAADPRRPRRLVATWQQDRFAVDGGALSNLVATSQNGGRTWRTIRLPGLSRCTQGSDERASDPWVSIGADGTIY